VRSSLYFQDLTSVQAVASNIRNLKSHLDTICKQNWGQVASMAVFSVFTRAASFGVARIRSDKRRTAELILQAFSILRTKESATGYFAEGGRAQVSRVRNLTWPGTLVKNPPS